mmetsp:Transcript_125559/g.250494  ORF Transcript_125559/g.250494 Transcript_125559/m.250494 type:complete len:108 (+) Transcript_125559:1637-1960(+)
MTSQKIMKVPISIFYEFLAVRALRLLLPSAAMVLSLFLPCQRSRCQYNRLSFTFCDQTMLLFLDFSTWEHGPFLEQNPAFEAAGIIAGANRCQLFLGGNEQQESATD